MDLQDKLNQFEAMITQSAINLNLKFVDGPGNEMVPQPHFVVSSTNGQLRGVLLLALADNS